MGNSQGHAGGLANRRDRRREITLLFYFIFGFVLIRVWILLIESKNVVVEIVGGVITLLLLLTLLLRYRIVHQQQQGQNGDNENNNDANDVDLAFLQAIFRTPAAGVSQDVINSLHCFYYTNGLDTVDEKSENDDTINPMAPAGSTPDLENQTSAISGDILEPIDSATMCSICLSDYIPHELILMLPCRHTFHCTCITEWLHAHTQCPLCKQDVLDLLNQRVYVEQQLHRLRTTSAQRPGQLVYDADALPDPPPPGSTAPGPVLPDPPPSPGNRQEPRLEARPPMSEMEPPVQSDELDGSPAAQGHVSAGPDSISASSAFGQARAAPESEEDKPESRGGGGEAV